MMKGLSKALFALGGGTIGGTVVALVGAAWGTGDTPITGSPLDFLCAALFIGTGMLSFLGAAVAHYISRD